MESSSQRQRIIGKKFGHENPDIVFAWDHGARSMMTENLLKGNSNPTLNRGKESQTYYQQETRQIHGQRINLHESMNENKRTVRSNSRGENRTLTPPPQRVSSAQREKVKFEDNPHRIHHKPGSTIPNLKAGSERTNRAAKWLVEEQYKVALTLIMTHSPSSIP
jgi:hypothetical protein